MQHRNQQHQRELEQEPALAARRAGVWGGSGRGYIPSNVSPFVDSGNRCCWDCEDRSGQDTMEPWEEAVGLTVYLCHGCTGFPRSMAVEHQISHRDYLNFNC